MKTNILDRVLVGYPQWALDGQKRLQAVFDNAIDAILMADEKMCFVDANPAACELTGYSREELLRLRVPDITPPANQDLLQELWQNLISAGKLEGEYQIRRKDGEIIAVEFRAVANVVPGLQFAILHDITARKAAEVLLRESQARTESILASVADAHILFDRQWRYLYVNEAAVRAIGKPREAILGHTLWELYPDIIGTELDQQYRLIMDERTAVVLDFHDETLDTWWENHFYPAPQGLAVFATNITERKRAERARAQTAAIVDSSDDAIFSKSLEGIILSWNRGAARLYGYSADEMIGHSVSTLVPSEKANEWVRIMEQLRQGHPIERQETVRLRKDGTRIQVSITISPVRDSDGQIRGAASIAQDISARKQAEAERQRLFRQVRAREKKLRSLANYLQTAREDERRRVAREIHDELGQALTALKMDLAWLAKRIPSQELALREKAAGMSSLINDTSITLRRIATELRPGLLDHLGLAAAIEWQAREFCQHTDLVCQLDLGDGRLEIDDQPAIQLFRIFQEALTNIARHAGATRVKIRLGTNKNGIVLSIKDNGQGMPKTDITNLKSVGLIGMRERAVACGGQLAIRSARGKGTQVEVRIPRSSVPVRASS